MKDYEVVLDEHVSIRISAKQVKVKSDNTLIFYNTRSSVSEQYLYGSDVVAVFNPGQYAYFNTL